MCKEITAVFWEKKTCLNSVSHATIVSTEKGVAKLFGVTVKCHLKCFGLNRNKIYLSKRSFWYPFSYAGWYTPGKGGGGGEGVYSPI